MTHGLELSLPRKIALIIIEALIKILWAIDRISSFNLKFIFKAIFRSLTLLISFSFIIFLIYSYSTGYLHKIAVELMSPGYVPLAPVELVYPRLVGSAPSPEITAVSSIAVEKNKNIVLFKKNITNKLAPASTVKLMTALVAMDVYNLDEEIPVPEICTQVEGTKAWFPKDSVYKVKDLIDSMLVGSAGDSACVLSLSKISEEEFIKRMNDKALENGMNSTVFSNPIGLDNVNGGHYSTVYDLYRLSVLATSVDEIKEAVAKTSIVISSVDESYKVYLPNTNRFLWELPNSVGVKTGTTEGAGEVLIYEYDDGLKDIVIVVMGSKDRFEDTRLILNWVNQNYSWN